jgi:hypothetical protein
MMETTEAIFFAKFDVALCPDACSWSLLGATDRNISQLASHCHVFKRWSLEWSENRITTDIQKDG